MNSDEADFNARRAAQMALERNPGNHNDGRRCTLCGGNGYGGKPCPHCGREPTQQQINEAREKGLIL